MRNIIAIVTLMILTIVITVGLISSVSKVEEPDTQEYLELIHKEQIVTDINDENIFITVYRFDFYSGNCNETDVFQYTGSEIRIYNPDADTNSRIRVEYSMDATVIEKYTNYEIIVYVISNLEGDVNMNLRLEVEFNYILDWEEGE